MRKNPDFKKDTCYSRDEIFNKLGGSKQYYLPMKNGQVLYGAFRKDLNPDAPKIVLPGTGPIIERSAHILATQKNPIPVFIKCDINNWKYMGDFVVKKLVEDSKVIEKHATKTHRADITMVLYLEEAK